MSNRTYLISTNLQTGNFHELTRLGEADPQLFDVIEEAARRIPLHWTACFRSSDVRKYSVEADGGQAWEYAAPCVAVSQALTNLAEAWPLVEEIVGDAEVAGALRRYTVSLLRSLPRPYLTMYVAEVAEGDGTELIEALAGSADALPALRDFADFETGSLPFELEEWQGSDVESGVDETYGAASGVSGAKAEGGPGIEPRWEKGWKRLRTNAIQWRETQGRDAALALEFYCRHQEPRDDYGYYPEDELPNLPFKPWEGIGCDLQMHALARLGEFEQRAVDDGVMDVTLATYAFAARYTAEMIAIHRSHLITHRYPQRRANRVDIEPTYAALGAVLGLDHQAFRLARLQLSECRQTGADMSYPVYRFILRLFADFLGETPPEEPTTGDREPLLLRLADQWRVQDAAALAPLWVAACDIHTRRTVYSGKKFHEFSNGRWTRIPVEVLLLFRLRHLLGLDIPAIDHPLMAPPFDRLPQTGAFRPDDLVRRVRAEMVADGYDEAGIFAEAYEGADRDAAIARDRREAGEQPADKPVEYRSPATPRKSGKLKRKGVRPDWIDQWNQPAFQFLFSSKKEPVASHVRLLSAYASGQAVVADKLVVPPLRSWEFGVGESLSFFAEAQLFELEKRGMSEDPEPYAATSAADAFVASYLKQLVAFFSLHFHALRFGGHEEETLRYTDIPYSALGMILGFDDEAERLFKLQFLMVRRRRNYAYHKGSYYPVFTFMIRVLADYFEVGPWIVEDNEEAAKIFNPLFDAWRDAGTEILAPLCLAACDYHTWETRREGFGTTEEFSNGSWNRTPIEILLIFELRRRLGLPNPVLDHPLMQTPLAILPESNKPAMSEMLQRVWARMRGEGFDESQMPEWLRERPSVAARCLPVVQGVMRGDANVPSQAATDDARPRPWWQFW